MSGLRFNDRRSGRIHVLDDNAKRGDWKLEVDVGAAVLLNQGRC
jgi:hypothetical protein